MVLTQGGLLTLSSGIYQLLLGFNDGLVADGDFDDMVVGLSITPVPEPETYALDARGYRLRSASLHVVAGRELSA